MFTGISSQLRLRPGKLPVLLLVLLVSFTPGFGSARAEIKFSALTTLGYTGLDRSSQINTMFRGDDPFNPVRVTLFAESWITPKLGVFLEFLWDQGDYPTGGSTKPRVNGAYAVARPFDTEALMFRIGMIPSSFGTWAPRTYADRNPLIGLPLMYHYRTPIKSNQLPLNADEVLSWRDQGNRGLPISYDSCWDQGFEVFGFFSRFEYAVALTKATMSSPRAYMNDAVQVLGRFGVKPVVGLNFGLSAEYGSYLDKNPIGLPPGVKTEDVHQQAVGLDFSYSYAHTSLYSEFVWTWWDSPNLTDYLAATSWYIEAKQVIVAGLYASARLDRIDYNSLVDSKGVSFKWGYPIDRVESGLGYHFTKDALVKLVWQHNGIVEEEDVDLLSAQLVLTF